MQKSDSEDKEFYYLGKVWVKEGSEREDMNVDKPVVKMDFELEKPLPNDLYHYLITE